MASKMNYKLVASADKSNYDVFETATEQVIGSFADQKDARYFMRQLNLGGGFDGWTPSFFLKDFKKYINKTSKSMYTLKA